ncbi:unnamed protein product [Phytophthora fragariaefolia]|uniref:Unnamed protein product n=1 Tax=Phytophthora fragariaefolia TaxID=1490495 RepID=A0A9W6XUX0_9STRA|nr:unnamed protein product [Phytophthora fragariaefolia]
MRLRKIKNFPETLFQEPVIWPLPQRVCNWIWEDPRVVDSNGNPKPLRQQLIELDEREPARILWATAANEVERTQYLDDEDDEDDDDDEASEVDDEDEGNGDEEDVEEDEAEEEEVEEGDTGEGDQ